MKKFVLLHLLLLVGIGVFAQNIVPYSKTGKVKFMDIIAQHKGQAESNNDEDDFKTGPHPREGKDHLFQKWEWYWQQHLDKDGYLVPSFTNMLEWQRYINEDKNRKHDAAKNTSSYPSNWVFMGPNTTPGGYAGIGRINVIAFDPIDSNTLYAGAAGGGTWKSTDGGTTWASLYDHLATMGVADIKVNPRNRNTIYVATGDADNWDAYSAGIISSTDGGATWNTTGLSWLPTAYHHARSLIINPADTNTMLLGTDTGLFITHNAGLSWTNVNTMNYKQLLYKPGDTTIVYGTIYPTYPDSSCQVIKSGNGGNTWSTNTYFTDAQRINIAICSASPSMVYAIASNQSSGLEGIYTSTDNGSSYYPVYVNDTGCHNNLLSYDLGLPSTGCGGQGWYDLCIAVNPANPSDITVGGVNTYNSVDGGTTWQIANTWYWSGSTGVQAVHADKHCLEYNPLTNALFETCDGGVYQNYEPVTGTWNNLCSGLCVTEFYRNAVANGVDFCIGGAQDNGTKMMSTSGSRDLTGGDGMQPLINYGDPNNIYYTSYQNGSIDMTRDGSVTYPNFYSITDTIHHTGGWISPFALHPTDTATLLLGYQSVWVTYNNGISWDSISPVFDTITSYISYINTLRISPTNPNYIYIVYNDYTVWNSVIYYTPDFGTTWSSISIPFTTFISDLKINPLNEKQFWVTCSGYSAADKVYKYDLASNTWTNETGSLPNLPVNCILIDTATQTKYIGTDAAIFVMNNTSTDWTLYNNNLPAVHVTDLNINYTTGDIWAATFGRGMWKSNKNDYPAGIPSNISTVTNTGISVVPNPTHGKFTINTTNANLLNTEVSVNLIRIDGKPAWHTNTNFGNSLKIDAKILPAGFYICEVSNNNVEFRCKIIIY